MGNEEENMLINQLEKFKADIQQMGCFEIPQLPIINLQNDIHPMFYINRWMQGYGQNTHQFYHRMKPALQLASLLITESCSLSWFVHLFYGKRRKTGTSTGRPYIYLGVTPSENTSSGRQMVRDDLLELSEVITFMFTPPTYSNHKYGKCWGATFAVENPFSDHFRPSDYPPYPSRAKMYIKNGYDLPQITLHNKFATFFNSGYRSCTPSQCLRIQFMFAVTIVHELAHAFWIWIGRAGSADPSGLRDPLIEPRWYKGEPYAELGYSWEAITLGRISQTMWWPESMITMNSPLVSSRTEIWGMHEAEPSIVSAVLHGGACFMEIPLSRGMRMANQIPMNGLRGEKWFLGESSTPQHHHHLQADKNCFCVVHTVPMVWVAKWFSEEEWEMKRMDWRMHGKATPPPLGNTFMLVYLKRGGEGARMWACRGGNVDPNLEWVDGAVRSVGLYDSGGQGGGLGFGYMGSGSGYSGVGGCGESSHGGSKYSWPKC